MIVKISDSSMKNKNISKKKSAEELYKPIIRKFNKRKVHSPLIDNIWGANLADIQLISKLSKGIRFLLRVTDIFSKHSYSFKRWKKGITITIAFWKILK